MKTETFDADILFDDAHRVFSDPRVLDAVHGRGLWRFDAWVEMNDGSYTRQGEIKGVEVPIFARALNNGKKHVICHVSQRYVLEKDTIHIMSHMHPKVLGVDMAHNSSRVAIYRHGNSCIVQVSYTNSTSLPHPLSSMAVDVMDDMSRETIDFLRDALEPRKKYVAIN